MSANFDFTSPDGCEHTFGEMWIIHSYTDYYLENGIYLQGLTDNACTFEGSTTAEDGRLSIEVKNTTFRFGSFGVVALYDGESVDDIALVRERVESRRLLRNRARSDVPPPFGRWIAGDGSSLMECVAIALVSTGVLYGALIGRQQSRPTEAIATR